MKEERGGNPVEHGYEAVQETVAAIRERDDRRPDIALVLGSGLGAFAEELSQAVAIAYDELPHFPVSGVPGHAGRLVMGRLGGRTLVVMQGRVHRYEGWTTAEVVFPVRVMRALGAAALVVTNAAGGVNESFSPGDLMAITDHLNLTGESPLEGPNDDRFGPRFPDMTRAYAPALLDALRRTAQSQGVALREGVYAGVRGPSYETPAEVRMLRALGADAVGMSTVPEVLAAAHMGMPCCGVACITNLAAGITALPLSHDEVKATAGRVQARFRSLLAALIPNLPLTR